MTLEIRITEINAPPPPKWNKFGVFTNFFTAVVFAVIFATLDNVWLRIGATVLLGIGYAFFRSHAEMWRERAHYAMSNHIGLLEFVQNASKEQLEANLGGMLSEFYEGSPITNHAITINKEEGLVIKVGDDQHMVKMDMEKFQEDPAAAMEAARIEWSSVKGDDDDFA